MCVCSTYVGVSMEARRRHWIHDSRDLWLQVVNHLTWALGTETRSTGREASTLHASVISPGLSNLIYGNLPKEFNPGERAKEDHGQTEKFRCIIYVMQQIM